MNAVLFIGIIIAVAVLFTIFSAVTMWAIYWARYPFPVKRKRRGKRGGGK